MKKAIDRRPKTGVELHPAYSRLKLNPGVLSLSSGRSTTQTETKYNLAVDYPKVAQWVLSFSSWLSTTQKKTEYNLTLGYPKVAHRVLSLSSGRSTTQQEAKYGSETDCITLSGQLSTTMPEAKYHLTLGYPEVTQGVNAVLIVPEKSEQADRMKRIEEICMVRCLLVYIRLRHGALTKSISTVFHKNTPANSGINRAGELTFVGSVINN